MNRLPSILLDFKRNKVRVFLTSLGIVIGVMSVVLLTALVLGLKNYISQQFEGLGANVVAVFPGSGPTPNFSSLAGSIRFDRRDVESLERIRSLDLVVPISISNVSIDTGTENTRGAVIGTTEEFDDLFSLSLIAGKYFDRSHVIGADKVGVIAESLAKDLYGDPERAVGEFVVAKDMRIKIIGAVENVGNPERDNGIMIPHTAAFETINPKREYFIIYLGVDEDQDFIAAKEVAEDTLLKRYDEDEFNLVEPTEVLSSLDQIFLAINGVLVTVASISLVVGGIGIMNIMYANVNERTREIGIRRAVGAGKGDVLAQFILESAILSLTGGVVGLVLSAVIVVAAQPFFPLEINLVSVIVALGVSGGIGVFFGAFPARRAANLTPIDAIRYE